jgi:crotonobetainyl-CoA:carnitine CoA-transferase CaiB-like acyl-CoA transferase
VAVTDISTGMVDESKYNISNYQIGLYAHGAILAALLSRQQTGRGVWIDCNLLETQVGSADDEKYDS